MNKSEDAGKYQLGNNGPVQGQVSGDHNTVNLHFYGTPNLTTPLPISDPLCNPAALKQPENRLTKETIKLPERVIPPESLDPSEQSNSPGIQEVNLANDRYKGVGFQEYMPPNWKQRLVIILAFTALVILVLLSIGWVYSILRQ